MLLLQKPLSPFLADGNTAAVYFRKKRKTARNYLEKLSESDYMEKKILLVEDNELNREIAGEICR